MPWPWKMRAGVLIALVSALLPAIVRAQGGVELPIFQPQESLLGPAPGSSGSSFAGEPGGSGGIVGGAGHARVPMTLSRPGSWIGYAQLKGEVIPTPSTRAGAAPPHGLLHLPEDDEDEGPPDGLNLDAAIEVLRNNNLSLRAKAFEIPQAQADVLTAGLRANPLLFADSQLIPYGAYDVVDNPGGPIQYDVNINYPLDVNRKRRARVAVASHARRVLEAQFQDAVRAEIANLYVLYVDVLAARETVRFAQAAVTGLDRILEVTKAQRAGSLKTQAEVNQIQIQRDAAAIGLLEAEAGLRSAKRALATLLNVPPQQALGIELRGTIHDRVPAPPDAEELISLAMTARPDLASFRLGVARAQADVRLAQANRFADVFVLVQPFTSQQNYAPGSSGSRSWAVGATVAIPLHDRNQGNIQRAQINVSQTRVELAALERQIINEVESAHGEYSVTRMAIERLSRDLLPAARHVLDTNFKLYREGETDLVSYLSAQRDYNELIRQYRDTLVRHRRSMLHVNTVVGERLLP